MSMRSHLWARRTSIYDRNDILTLNRGSLCIEKRKARMINLQLTCSSPWLVLRMASNTYFLLGGEFESTVSWSLESTDDMQVVFNWGWAGTSISKLPC